MSRVGSPPPGAAKRPVVLQAPDPYRRFLGWSLGAAILGLSVLIALPSPLARTSIAACLASLVMATWTALGFARQWSVPRRSRGRAGLWLGLAFIVGGVAFDITATLLHSPDLSAEGNPVAVVLLTQGVSSTWVKVIGVTAQALLLVCGLLLWCNFHARREWYLAQLSDVGDGSLSRRMLGWRDLSLGSMLLGRGGDAAVQVCTLGAVSLGVFAYRWYLGLEWFGLVPISRTVAPVACLLLAWLALYSWVCHRLSHRPPHAPESPPT